MVSNNEEENQNSFISKLERASKLSESPEVRALLQDALKEIGVRRNETFGLQSTSILDIFERQRLENQYKDLYDNAPVGYHSLNSDGFIAQINNIHLAWLGYSKEEVVGKLHATDILTKDARIGFEERFEAIKRTGVSGSSESRLLRKDGSEFPVLLGVSAIYDMAGQFISTRTVVWDISEKKKLEEELLKTSEKLFQANAEKNTFIGIASHDLQNPITAVAMSAELLTKTGANLTEIQRKLLKNIRSSTDRMRYIVTNILTINRIERGILSSDWQSVNLKSLIWDIVNRYLIFANRKHIDVILLIDEKISWDIWTEPNYLTQAVENLLSNAIKFSEINKTINIELQKREKHVDIIIADEGQGIKEEEMGRVFGKFQKLSAKPTGGEISTGLGLSVAKEFVEILRGRITFQSTWGIGTIFTITLPIEGILIKNSEG